MMTFLPPIKRGVIRINDTGWRIFQIQKFLRLFCRFLCLQVTCCTDVLIRDFQLQFIHCPVKTCQPVFGNCRTIRAVRGCKRSSVSLRINISDQIFHALNVVRADRRAVVMQVVNGDNRYFAIHQFHDTRVVKIRTHNCNSFKIPVSAMFIIGHLAIFKTGIDKCDIVPLLLCLNFKTVEHTREIFTGKTAARLFLKEDSYIIGTVCL